MLIMRIWKNRAHGFALHWDGVEVGLGGKINTSRGNWIFLAMYFLRIGRRELALFLLFPLPFHLLSLLLLLAELFLLNPLGLLEAFHEAGFLEGFPLVRLQFRQEFLLVDGIAEDQGLGDRHQHGDEIIIGQT